MNLVYMYMASFYDLHIDRFFNSSITVPSLSLSDLGSPHSLRKGEDCSCTVVRVFLWSGSKNRGHNFFIFSFN